MKILFSGDSITDVGRNREDPASLGAGYPLLIAARLGARQPGAYTFRNTGVSGDRVVDVYARIKRDCWNLEPDLVSILLGINDVWHELGSRNGVDAERFYRVYRMLAADTRERLPQAKLLLMEPFVLPGDSTREGWEYFTREVPLRAQAVRQVAEEFSALYLPLQTILDEHCKAASPDYWLVDGVHPTPAGHQLIAEAWLELFDREINR